MKPVIIIGAGIGGLATAIALHKAGFRVEVFERAAILKEVGAGIALSPNAMRILQHLGVMQQVVDCSTVLEAAASFTSTGEKIASIATNHPLFPTVSLHRADLHKVLAAAIPADCLHLGEELVRIENSASEVKAFFASGNSISAGVLIGADGLRSKVRAELLGDGGPVYRGYQCWRGVSTVPSTNILTETFGAGVRLGVVPIGSRQTAWWCTANEPEMTKDAPDGPRAKLLRLLGNWHDPIPTLIKNTDESAIIKTAIYDRLPAKKWSKGKCTLLGDAAHPSTPNMGQGACMAIEDAAVLSRCLSQYPEPEAAFQAYEKLRYRRTSEVTQISRYYGAMGQWENPFAAAFRKSIIRLSSGKAGSRGYSKFVNYDCLNSALPALKA